MRLSYFALMYSGDGNRKYKMTGTCELHEPRYAAMTADLSFDDVVLYPNPYITVTPKGYTKHYFMGAERFCTTIGGGNNGLWLVNPIDHLTQDEANLLDTLENSVFYTHYYYDLYEYHHCHSHTENTDYTGTVMPNDGVYELYQYTEDEQTLGTVTLTFYSKFEDKIHEYSSGKSTILSLPCIALFGKTPGLTKSAIHNRINKHGWIRAIIEKGGHENYYMSNEYGMYRFPEEGRGFSRYTTAHNNEDYMVGNYYYQGDNYISAEAFVNFYNAIQDFYNQNNITIYYGDISAYDPSINLGHLTHMSGNSIDIHYIGNNGAELIGNDAYSRANVALMNAFFRCVQGYGFTKNYSYGNRFLHSGNPNQRVHKHHFHIGL